MREHLSATSAKLVARIVDVCLLALLIATACGSAPSGSPAPNQASFPVTIHQSDGSAVTLTNRPRRIVSLSPTATDDLFAEVARRDSLVDSIRRDFHVMIAGPTTLPPAPNDAEIVTIFMEPPVATPRVARSGG